MRAHMSVQAVALGATVALLAGGPAVARAASPPSPPPTEVISPLPGTPDASPDTQISFLGAPASQLRNISVVGSRSGTHSGRLRFYSTHTGGSFLPTRPFIAGETVTVKAQIVGNGAPLTVGTTFTVSQPVTLSGAGPVQSATPVDRTCSTSTRVRTSSRRRSASRPPPPIRRSVTFSSRPTRAPGRPGR